jgi:KUP system potassium uptake protein
MDVHSETEQTEKTRNLALGLAALGVVFGDIGTSPLYALKVCFAGGHGLPLNPANVLGVLSLILWSLVGVISVKYLVVVLRADNSGEGGIMALMAIARKRFAPDRRLFWLLTVMGVFGAALLYGDGMITPAISVLSAAEGLEVAAPGLSHFVVPLTIVLLIFLFLFQRKGTAGVGAVFGPVMLVWFSVLAALGIHGIIKAPKVLAAVNPLHAVHFFLRNGTSGFLVLGAVFLVVTGGEALYADMGHFGKGPIRLTWFSLVFPALVLNYFGQGGLLMTHPGAEANPFFKLAPHWALLPLILLSTAATIIASQAVISGSFSLARQAVQLGFSPRLDIRHTSEETVGQIYVPSVNWMLMIATIALVLGFRTSDNLAAAYGVAVTTTMVITTILLFFVARWLWHWPLWVVVPVTALFAVPDLAFFGANMVKVHEGGWFPLLVAAVGFTLMTTWKSGRGILYERIQEKQLPSDLFLADLERNEPHTVEGTAVFMTGNAKGVPTTLLHNLKHNHVMHERVVLLTLESEEVPRIPTRERLRVEEMGHGIYRMRARYGYMETPDVPALLKSAQRYGFTFEPMRTTFFLGRDTLIPSPRPGMAIWRERLFALMARNAQGATFFFNLPPNRVVELGAQIEL